MVTITSNSPEETFQLGVSWAREMESGWIVGLSGDLGAGKTQLVKGLAAGWGIKERIASPTFNLMHEHETATEQLIHMDLYRLETPDAIWDAGLAEYLQSPSPGWVIVEWIDRWTQSTLRDRTRVPDMKKPFRWIQIEGDLEQERTIVYEDFRD
jgi:tRNA threonylcarbamoyladenosine biosynthesis protein TsaE